MKRIILSAILAPLLLFLIQAITASVVLPPMPVAEGGLGLVVLSVLISAWVLLTLAVTLTVRGWRRMAILFVVGAGIPANSLIEAVFFSLDIPRAHLLPLFLYTLVSGALFAVALDQLVGVASAAGASVPPRATSAWAMRFAACDVTYIALYFAAGFAVWPFVSHFYASRPLPETHAVALMQVFRGLVFSAIVYTMMRWIGLPRATGALLVGATFALLGGVAPLLMPNPYMPASIRYPHMVETGVSNLIFGLIAARLLTAP